MRRYPGFVGPAYTSQSRRADAEDLINWRVVQLRPRAPRCAGALPDARRGVAFIVLPQSPVRGLFYQEGRAFAVAGGKLHEFFADFTHDRARRPSPRTPTPRR
jgi:hypothetical protein